jgi:hypothetical protein
VDSKRCMKGVTWKANTVRTGNNFQSQCATNGIVVLVLTLFHFTWIPFIALTRTELSSFLYALWPPLKIHNRKVRKCQNPWKSRLPSM